MRRLSSVLFATGCVLFACRSNDNNFADGGGGGGGGNDGNNGGFNTIQEIQGSGIAPLTLVSVKDVVVTAIDTRSTNSSLGNFWVEEPEGGPFSGVLVHGAPTPDVAALAVGDVVTITGAQKDEFALSSDTSGNTDTELDTPTGGKMSVQVTSTGASLPTPVAVDALMFGQASSNADCKTNETGCATNVDWEMFEGVLVTVTTTSGGVTAFGAPKGSGNKESFNTNGQIDVENTLADFPTITSGECLASVTGVIDYFFQYNLLPTTTAGVAAGGAGCPAREVSSGTTVGACGDTMDNDGNGFSDCEDLSCQTGSAAWLDPDNCDHATNGATCGCSTNLAAAGGVSSIDTGATATFAPVILNEVIVTGVAKNGFWIADKAQAATNGGLFVFTSTTPTVTQGQTLSTLQGIAEAFNPSKLAAGSAVDVLEFEDATLGTASGNTAAIALASTASAAASLGSGGAALAGSLLKLSDVKVTAQGSFNQCTLTDNTGATITLDDTAFFGYGGGSAATLPAVGTCFTSLTGLTTLTTSDGSDLDEVRTINPRGSADMVTGAGCN